MPGLLQDHGDSENIITPIPDAPLGQIVQVKCKMSGKLRRSDNQLAILSRRHGNASAKADCTRHNKTVVIVGMLPD